MNILRMYNISWYIPIKKYREKFRNIIKKEWESNILLENLENHITEHCNLACFSCCTYSQLSKEVYYDIYQFEKDIKQISKITNTCIKHVKILGGEPLLNKQCKDYFPIVRKYFPFSHIVIVTNGILLTKQDEAFWKSIKYNNVQILQTDYPINLNKDKILELVQKYGINHSFYYGGKEKKYSFTSNLDIKGLQDPNVSFKNCSPDCYLMKNGKIYLCSTVGHINHFNEYFKVKLEINEKDYIDIYSSSRNDIINYLKNPIPFCKYCVRPAKEVGEWRPSKKIIDEYLYDKN